MAITVKSMATSGVDGFMVEIEASTIRGQQQSLSIIGLPDQAIKEAGERIQAAIESCGYGHIGVRYCEIFMNELIRIDEATRM